MELEQAFQPTDWITYGIKHYWSKQVMEWLCYGMVKKSLKILEEGNGNGQS